MVDEDKYAELVERRRNEDDFVVDDSKAHYTTGVLSHDSLHILQFSDT
jgi:hypothetical protein